MRLADLPHRERVMGVLPIRTTSHCDDCTRYPSLISREGEGEHLAALRELYQRHLTVRHDYTSAAASVIVRTVK
jgi:hypothetical protein